MPKPTGPRSRSPRSNGLPLTASAIEAGRSIDARALRPEVETVARQCVLDWLGVALAGSREAVATRVREASADWSANGGARTATVIGAPGAIGVLDATLCNGVAGHALDYDDTLAGPFHGHATASILPAALALAEERDASLRHLLAALVAGIASATVIGRAMNPAHYDAGWHSSAVLGAFGSAAACAHLLALDAPGWTRALGLAGVQAAGLTAVFGTMAKPFQLGKAAVNGLMAARLADSGVESPEDLLEHERGVLAMHAGRPGAWPAVADGDAILATLFKNHASCHGTHAAIEAVTRLRAEHGLSPEDVDAIELEVAPSLLPICDGSVPATGLAAKFSLRAVAAMALAGEDTTSPATFTDATVRMPTLRAIAERVVVRSDPRLSEWQARATLNLVGGRAVGCCVDVGVVPPKPELRWPALARKAERLAAPALGRVRAAALPELVRELDPDAPARELTLAAGVEPGRKALR